MLKSTTSGSPSSLSSRSASVESLVTIHEPVDDATTATRNSSSSSSALTRWLDAIFTTLRSSRQLLRIFSNSISWPGVKNLRLGKVTSISLFLRRTPSQKTRGGGGKERLSGPGGSIASVFVFWVVVTGSNLTEACCLYFLDGGGGGEKRDGKSGLGVVRTVLPDCQPTFLL